VFPFQSPLWKPAAWLVLGAFGLGPSVAAHSAPATAAALWQQMLDDDVSDWRDPGPGDPSAQLALALAWMQREPRTEGNLEQARRLLRSLAADAAVAPPAGLIAEYLLGRIAHLYRYPTDPATAAQHYHKVLTRGGDAPFAQHVAVRYIMARLADAPDASAAHARWHEGVALVEGFTESDARRDGHLVLTNLGLYWSVSDELVLRQALAADAETLHQAGSRFTLHLTIANVAARSGRPDLAREYYTRILAHTPRNPKLSLIADRLAALPPEAKP
jgi:hypothetical protein